MAEVNRSSVHCSHSYHIVISMKKEREEVAKAEGTGDQARKKEGKEQNVLRVSLQLAATVWSIHFLTWETRANTAGWRALQYAVPQEEAPTRDHTPSFSHTRGPPESP